MKNIGYKLALLLGGLFLIVAGLSPASAQDKDKKEVKKEVVVKVDEDGNITINGEPAEEGEVVMPDGSKMIVDKEGGRVIVIEEDDGGRKVIRRRVQAPDWDDDENLFIFESDDDGEPRMFRHRIRVPDLDDKLNVMVERFEAPHGINEWHVKGPDDMAHAMRMRSHAPFGDFEFDFEGLNPEIMKLEAETHKLARKIMESDGAEKRELEQELSDKLNQIFEQKLESRQKRIEKLQKRLEKEQAELRERQQARREIIDRRKDELLGDDKLEW